MTARAGRTPHAHPYREDTVTPGQALGFLLGLAVLLLLLALFLSTGEVPA